MSHSRSPRKGALTGTSTSPLPGWPSAFSVRVPCWPQTRRLRLIVLRWGEGALTLEGPGPCFCWAEGCVHWRLLWSEHLVVSSQDWGGGGGGDGGCTQMLSEGSRPRLGYVRNEQRQKLGVERKVDQVPSGLGSGAESSASVTGDMGRVPRASSPTSRPYLAGRGAGAVRVLGSPHGAEEESVSHLWTPVLCTPFTLTERLPCTSEGWWPRPGDGGQRAPCILPSFLCLCLLETTRQKHHGTEMETERALTFPLD